MDDDGEEQVVAIKAGKTKENFVLEPHDIVKELRLLSSLSHPAVRTYFLSAEVRMFTAVQIISVLGYDYDASQSLQRFWMPLMPFTLADLLSVPTFSPIFDSDVPHDAQSILGFALVTKSIIHQILSGVAYLHSPERRIAHRDIKPRNILLDTLGVAVLIDFGVAYSPTAGHRDVWPEPEGKMYFEVGSGYVPCFLSPVSADVDQLLSFSDLIALQSSSLVYVSTMRLRATCGLSVPHLRNASRHFTVAFYPVTLMTIRTPRRGAILQRHIYSTNFLSHCRVLSGNAIRCLMDRVVISVLHGAYFAPVDRPRKKHGLSVFFYLSIQPWAYLMFDCDQTFSDLPDANKINFIDSPGVHLSTLLPHLGAPFQHGNQVHFPRREQQPTVIDLLQRLLVYPPDSRLKAADALVHPWLLSDAPLVLPRAAVLSDNMPTYAAESRNGKGAGEWLRLFLAPGLL